MTTTSSVAPLVKTATVPCTAERAFALFTKEIGAWWPVTTHSVGTSAGSRVHMDDHTGGHITETLSDDTTTTWGTITAWQPPRRVAFSWHPGRPAAEATEVEVTFDEPDDSGTRVTLVHHGWSGRADGAAARDRYDSGWAHVLGQFSAAASATNQGEGSR